MQLSDVTDLLAGLEGVRHSGGDGRPHQWRLRGRLVARQTDETHLVIRATFAHRDALHAQFPGTFSIPARFRAHMMIVADLESGDARAIADALVAAWELQRSA